MARKLLLILPVTAFICAAAPVEFEVASIKVAPPLKEQAMSGKMHVGMKIDKAIVDIGAMSLADLIPIAFHVKPWQVQGPDWLNQQRFDIQARIPEGATPAEMPEMLKALLIDRFKLSARMESKERNVYALIIGKNGSKLKEAPPEDPSEPPPNNQTSFRPPTPQTTPDGGRSFSVNAGRLGTARTMMGADGMMHMDIARVPMPLLADMLSRFVDRPVIDMTDLKGDYQISLRIALADMMNMANAAGVVAIQRPGGSPLPGSGPAGIAGAASEPGGTSVFASVEEMGLKLDARKAPADTVVVDHVEKQPTEN